MNATRALTPTATAASADSWVPRPSGPSSASPGMPHRFITRSTRTARRWRRSATSGCSPPSASRLAARRADHQVRTRAPNTAASHTVSRFPVIAARSTGTAGPPATIATGITTIASSQGSAPPRNAPSRIHHCVTLTRRSCAPTPSRLHPSTRPREPDLRRSLHQHLHARGVLHPQACAGLPRVLPDHRREVELLPQPLQVGAVGTQGGIAVVQGLGDVHRAGLLWGSGQPHLAHPVPGL